MSRASFSLSWSPSHVASTILPTPGYRQYAWTAEAVERLGLDPQKLPPFVTTGDEVGRVSRAASLFTSSVS